MTRGQKMCAFIKAFCLIQKLAKVGQSNKLFARVVGTERAATRNVGSGASYELKTAVRVDQAYDFFMNFLGCNLRFNDQFFCLPF